MKTNSKILLLFTAIMCLGNSCSNDDEENLVPFIEEEQKELDKGRFDNSLFKWDYESPTSKEVDQIYIGDLFTSPFDVEIASVLSADVKTKATYSGIGRGRGGVYTGGRNGSSNSGTDEKDVESPYRKEDLFVENPVGVYVGAAYPAKSFSTSFQNEILYPRNPQEFTFDFPVDPFFYDTDKETGSRGYKMGYKEAMQSEEYKKHINSRKSENFDYKYSRFDSYSDVEKAFGANVKLGAFFSAEVKRNSKRTNIKGRLLAQVISKNFSVYMEMANPAKGFFQDATYNTLNSRISKKDASVYLKSLTYGKVAYVAIESEYSYDEVKLAVETSFKVGFVGGKANYDQKTLDIFSKSNITIYVISSDAGDAKFYDSAESIKTVFSVPYGIGSHGLPIYCQGRYIHNNDAFYLSDLEEKVLNTGRGRGIGTRPSTGTNTRPSTRPSYTSGERTQ